MKDNQKDKRKPMPAQAPAPDAGAPETTTPTIAQCESAASHKMPKPTKPEDSPVLPKDTPNPNPAITQAEVLALFDAHFVYTLAAADLERRRGEMRLRLLQLANVEPGDFEIWVTMDGKLLCVNHESVEEERIIIS
jgi:hypothetical protein